MKKLHQTIIDYLDDKKLNYLVFNNIIVYEGRLASHSIDMIDVYIQNDCASIIRDIEVKTRLLKYID